MEKRSFEPEYSLKVQYFKILRGISLVIYSRKNNKIHPAKFQNCSVIKHKESPLILIIFNK